MPGEGRSLPERLLSLKRTAGTEQFANRERRMNIAEPMTLLTDYLLAGLVFYLGLQLQAESRRSGQQSVRFWAVGFHASAAAALTGGTYHGFLPFLGVLPAALLWKLTVFAVGVAALFLFAGAVMATLKGAVRRWLLALAVIKFFIYLGWMTFHDAFRFVIYDYVPALLGIAALAGHAALSRRERFAPWLLAGVAVSFAAAGIQASGLTLHRHFNHNDLYHVVQMGAFWLLYKGGLRLRDRSN